MASDKRDFSDFHKFPGKISDGWYVFPALYSLDSMGRRRVWYINIRLIATPGGSRPARRKIDWDYTQDTVVPIKTNMLDGKKDSIPKNVIAQIWTIQGIDPKLTVGHTYKPTKSIPTYILKGKNINHTNETTVLTQALILARSKYLKKKGAATDDSARVYPVAVHKYDIIPKDTSRRLVYPIAVQRKLDGGRVVAYEDCRGKIVLYSRKLKDVPGHKHIEDALTKIYKFIDEKIPGAYLDGELYKHGLSLQVISGLMRREKDSKTDAKEAKNNKDPKTLLEYHVFDIFFPMSSEGLRAMPYIERMVILEQLFKHIGEVDSSLLTHVRKVQTVVANTAEEEEMLYKKFLTEGYEGSIVRNLHAPYEFGEHKEIRTYQMRKRKQRHSSEFIVVGYTQGTQGKDIGAIIWVLQTDKKIKFTATPVNANYEERYKAFREMTSEKFNKRYKGHLMTVEYDDVSDDGVPLRAKTKGIRTID